MNAISFNRLAVLSAFITLGALFQFGHFLEHLAQWLMWVFSDRAHPWMSPIAQWLTMGLSKLFDNGICTATGAKPMVMGMETLHLLGNSIFLGTMGLMLISDHMKGMKVNSWLKWAFIIEGIHLIEHLSLTGTCIFMGKALGASTLYGYASTLPIDAAVGYRVSFHFFMNLIPTALLMMAWLKRNEYKAV
jgi:hypothetical protein